MRKFFIPLSLAIGLSCGASYFYLYPNGLDTFKQKQIHDILYDIYFPADEEMTSLQKAKRLLYKNMIWLRVKKNEMAQQLLTPLVTLKKNLPPELIQAYPDVIRGGINAVSSDRVEAFQRDLMRLSSLEDQKNIFLARQAWLYLAYSTPLSAELANIPEPILPMEMDIPLSLPPSALYLEGNRIQHSQGEIDYLIIGSGPAGSVIAHELTRLTSARVVLVEAGPFVKPLCTQTQFDGRLMESQNQRRTISKGLMVRNGRAVGGGSTVNIDLAFSPLLPEIRAKLQGWMDEKALNSSFFHDPQEKWGKLKKAYQWVQGRMHTRVVTADEINENNHLLLRGISSAKTYALNQKKAGIGEIVKHSSVETLIIPALQKSQEYKGHLSLISDARVSGIVLKNNQREKYAEEVTLTFNEPCSHPYVVKDLNQFHPSPNQPYTIKAKNIILCAGSLGSAEILLRSPIANPHIGRGLVLHPSIGVIGIFPRRIDPLQGLSASVYAPGPNGSYIFEAMSAEPNFIAAIHPGSGKDILKTIRQFRNLGGFGIMLVDSVSNKNRVFIDKKTDTVQVDYQLSAGDKQRMKEGLSEAIKALLRQGAQSVFLPSSEIMVEDGVFRPFEGEGEVAQKLGKLSLKEGLNFISSAHMQGTNKLSVSPKKGVVSPRFRVWDPEQHLEIQNLMVCDSSVFPTSVGANPMQAIYTIAKLFVDEIIDEIANKTRKISP